MKAMSDYKLSTSNLIRKQEYAANITTPREYQIELFERAKTQNTIAVLDTGTKSTDTFVAAACLIVLQARERL
jgi:endoribonuclease Dicer